MDTQHTVSTDVKNESTTITSYPQFEEIYIKEEPREEIEDCDSCENVLQSKEECVIDNGKASCSKTLSSIKKRPRGYSFSVAEKKYIMNVHKDICEKNPQKGSLENNKLTCQATGVHMSSLYRLLTEYKTNNGIFSSPKKTRARKSMLDDIDDFVRDAIRQKVHAFYFLNEVPTLDKLVQSINDDKDLPNLKRTTLHKLLKELKFNKYSISEKANSISEKIKLINQEASMDTQLHQVSADTENEDTTTTNHQKIEEIYIKEEPLEETSQDCELFGSVLPSVKKEECITDSDEQSDKEYDNSIENTNFCCAVCNKSFTRKTNLNKHLEIHDENKKFDCSICEKISPLDSNFKNSMRRHIHCPTCQKLFTEKRNLNAHMKIHTETKQYQCGVCNKLYLYKNTLKQHIKTHSEVKAYKCSICNKSFRQSSSLSNHMKVHNKTHKCKTCNKQFTRSKSLTKHMELHTRIVKKYQCTVCKRSFANNSCLSSHMMIHTEIKNYQCSLCEKSFTRKSHVNMHMNWMHNSASEST